MTTPPLWPSKTHKKYTRREDDMIITHNSITPQIDPSAYIQASAHIIGDVHIGAESEEIESLHHSAHNYVRFSREYQEQGIQ